MIKRYACILLTLFLACNLVVLPAAAQEHVASAPAAILVEKDGTLLYTDQLNHMIWQQAPGQAPKALAGNSSIKDAQGLPVGGYDDGDAASAQFHSPWGIAHFRNGYAIADTENNVIRYVADGQVSTLAGNGKQGFVNDIGTKAAFRHPSGLVALEDGSLLVADTGNHVIRRIDPSGNVSVYAGSREGSTQANASAVTLLEPTGLSYAHGVVYIADTGNHRISKLENGQLRILAGADDGSEGYMNGKAASARFSSPQGVFSNGTQVYVADTGNGALRVIQDGVVYTLAQTGQEGYRFYPVSPVGLAQSATELYVGDRFAQLIFTVPYTSARTYGDVRPGDWFYNAVKLISSQGIFIGLEKDKFVPNGSITRAESMMMLAHLEQSIHPNVVMGTEFSFEDVSLEASYAASVAWAKDAGIVNSGDDGMFHPNDQVTRAQIVQWFHRYAQYAGVHTTTSAMPADFSDRNQIPAGAEASFAWACSKGLIVGDQNHRLSPHAPMKRAQLAVMIQRFISM